MEENKLDQIYEKQNNMSENDKHPQREKSLLKAICFGLCVSVVAALLLTGISVWAEKEYFILIVLGILAEAYVLKLFSPNKVIGACLGAILCAGTFLLYQILMANFGYSYVEDAEIKFYSGLIISALFGGIYGYRGIDGLED